MLPPWLIGIPPIGVASIGFVISLPELGRAGIGIVMVPGCGWDGPIGIGICPAGAGCPDIGICI
jgi:hypothetical protein